MQLRKSMLASLKNIFILGIGGIGTSALAKFFKKNGKEVFGYDIIPSLRTKELEDEGIIISYEDELKKIPLKIMDEKEHSLIVYTPAIPDHLNLYQYFLQHNFKVKKRAEVLGIISENTKNISVAGTHGKTTTTAILTHLMMANDANIAAFVGGIMTNYNSNYVFKKGSGGDITITEADEFDRSFLHLFPSIALITSVDADHLDIYKNKQNFDLSFQIFAQQVNQNNLIVNYRIKEQFAGALTYGIEEGDYKPKNLQSTEDGWYFDIQTPQNSYQNFQLNYGGKHNLENAIGAISLALHFGMAINDIKEKLATFSGIKRRFEKVIDKPNILFIDDYAHHPQEIKSTLKSLKEKYPKRTILGVFQPHLYSRTQDFLDEFAQALSLLDKCYLLPIYPAREKPIPGITSVKIAQKMKPQVKVVTKTALLSAIKREKFDVIITLGAGDIGLLVEPIKRILSDEK